MLGASGPSYGEPVGDGEGHPGIWLSAAATAAAALTKAA
jgi:hypothetical protein